MCKGILTKTGRLQKRFLPAVYFDSSVLIDYWIAEGMEEIPYQKEIELNTEPSYFQIVRKICRSKNRIPEVVKIREKLIFEEVKVTPVVSPLSLLELIEWQAESAFKQIASEVVGVKFIQKKGKKDIGSYLKRLLEWRKDEIKEQKKNKRESFVSTGLELLMLETCLNSSFAEVHGLRGLLQVDIINFGLTIDKAWSEPYFYAFLQLGVADIMHILLAQHLGCEYIASFDEDFKRVKDIIAEEKGITILIEPKEILDIL